MTHHSIGWGLETVSKIVDIGELLLDDVTLWKWLEYLTDQCTKQSQCAKYYSQITDPTFVYSRKTTESSLGLYPTGFYHQGRYGKKKRC